MNGIEFMIKVESGARVIFQYLYAFKADFIMLWKTLLRRLLYFAFQFSNWNYLMIRDIWDGQLQMGSFHLNLRIYTCALEQLAVHISV